MKSNSSIAAIVVLLIFLIIFITGNVAQTGLALQYVPPTSNSIQRFPEAGSKYAGMLDDFRSVKFTPNKTDILVGAKGYVFRLNLEKFQIINTNSTNNVLLVPVDPTLVKRCQLNRVDQNECFNYILFAVYNTTSEIFICGTGSLSARCYLVSADTFKITKLVKGDFGDKNDFVSDFPSDNVVGLTAANHAIFSAGKDRRTNLIQAIYWDGIKMTSSKPDIHFNSAKFVYAYEADDGFVYFFFTETAEEMSDRRMVYSRVGRVCSYDRGSHIIDYDTFLSFTKSQIVCYKKGRVSDFYDHIQSATAIEVHDKNGDSEVYIYASFTTTIRSTGSSAVCRYKFKDIQNLFNTSRYYVKIEDNGKVKYEPQNHPKPSADMSRIKCDAKLNTEALRDVNGLWGSSNPLLYDDIEPFDKNTVVTLRGQRVTALAVQDIHYDVNKTDVGKHILFAGTSSGKIFKLVMNSTNVGIPVFLEEIQAMEAGGIMTIMLHNNYIVVSGKSKMVRVEKERCESKYLMCSVCLKSRDPFCAWSLSQKKCTRAFEVPESDRIQDVEGGSDEKCPPVDVNISCSLSVIENIPGAWTALQCTGHGKIAPKVLAWKKDEARLNVVQSVYEIRQHNESSQLLIIKGYSMKELGVYGCVVGLGKNKSECTIPVKGEKPEINCLANTTNCSCAIAGYPFPSMRKVVQGNQTVRINHSGPIFLNPGVLLFAFNSFGDDVYTCPIIVVPTMIVTTTATTSATTTTTTTTTTKSPTTISTTQTTTSKKSTNASTSTEVTTTKPTVIPTTQKTKKPATTERKTTKKAKTEQTSKPTRTRTSTRAPPVSPGGRVDIIRVETDKYFIPFVICLVLLIFFIVSAVAVFACHRFRKRKAYDSEGGDDFDGKKGTLKISPSKGKKRPLVVHFQKKGHKVSKTDSSKPLVKKECSEPLNGSTQNHTKYTKTAKEMDDSGSNESSRYITHIKT